MGTRVTGTIVYDADCGFCTRCATWLGRHGSATLQPWQGLGDDGLAALGLTVDDVTSAAYWLGPDGRVAERGAGAVAAALRSCRGGWAVLGRIAGLRVLRPLADAVYAVVARYRYRLPGGTAACRI